jgi:hypothetical protein
MDFMNAKSFSLLLLLICGFLSLQFLESCAKATRKNVLNMPLQDVFDHKLLTGLGIEVHDIPEQKFDTDIMVFVNQFIRDAKERGVLIPEENLSTLRTILWVDHLAIGDQPGVMAVCNRYYTNEETLSGSKRVRWTTIEVHRKNTDNYIKDDKSILQIRFREVIYHELVHCLLNKGHSPNNVPGLMNAFFAQGSKRAVETWGGLLKQLFSKDYLALLPDIS